MARRDKKVGKYAGLSIVRTLRTSKFRMAGPTDMMIGAHFVSIHDDPRVKATEAANALHHELWHGGDISTCKTCNPEAEQVRRAFIARIRTSVPYISRDGRLEFLATGGNATPEKVEEFLRGNAAFQKRKEGKQNRRSKKK